MNLFYECQEPATLEELKHVNINIFDGKLPKDFIDHYAEQNGGSPQKDWFPATDNWDAIWIQIFYPIKNSEDNEPTMEEHYKKMLDRGVIPKNLVPFAVDPGGNFFCLDLNSEAVVYRTTDTLDPDSRVIAKSFAEFMSQLTTEDNAFG